MKIEGKKSNDAATPPQPPWQRRLCKALRAAWWAGSVRDQLIHRLTGRHRLELMRILGAHHAHVFSEDRGIAQPVVIRGEVCYLVEDARDLLGQTLLSFRRQLMLLTECRSCGLGLMVVGPSDFPVLPGVVHLRVDAPDAAGARA